MRKIETVVVGLPVKNEGKSLYNSLESIRKAILISDEKDIKLIICINGCTDASEDIAKKFKGDFSDISCEIINSDEGLVNAQRRIVESYKVDAYVFPDADSMIDEVSIRLLLQELRLNPSLVVAYARTRALHDWKNKSIFYKMGLLYDSQKFLTKRHYFHGRLFATTDWFIPVDADVLIRAGSDKNSSVLLKYCKHGILFSVEDIFMSSYFIHKYGLSSIRQINDAVCYSWSVGSLSDWINSYRRRNIEMEKMYRWFPEYTYLKPYLNRHTDWREIFRAKASDIILWTLFLLMRFLLAVFLSLELWLINFDFYKPRKQWVTISTSKKSFHE